MSCSDCGDYSTNRIVIEEIGRLRAEGSSRIGELKYTIRIAEHSWYLNWSSRLNTIYFEKDPPRKLSKWEKKGRAKDVRREESRPTGTAIIVYVGDDNADEA